MLIHNYSAGTGEFIDTSEARESPNEAGKFLIPALAAITAPPEDIPAGNVALFLNENDIPPMDFNGGSWSLKIDRRGQYWQTENAKPFYLDEIGVDPLERGLTEIEPVGAVKWDGNGWIVDADKLATNAKTTRDGLLTNAAMQIAPLADAETLNIATADEAALLTHWRQYRVDLSRIELQENFPLDINWPVAPGSIAPAALISPAAPDASVTVTVPKRKRKK